MADNNQDWIFQDQEADDHISTVAESIDDTQDYESLFNSPGGLYGENPGESDEDFDTESLTNIYETQTANTGLGGLSDQQSKLVILGIVAALVILAMMILFSFNPISVFTGAPDAATEPDPQASEQQAANGPVGSDAEGSSVALPASQIPLHDSGITFEPPVKKDDMYLLAAGDVSWGGEITTDDTGETLTLEGPTAAQVKRSLTFKEGSISTGVFGRTAPDKPMQHATSHRLLLTGQEKTAGTFYEVDGTELKSMGAYFDYRDGDEITRTYVEMNPDDPQSGVKDVYATTFDSPLAKDKEGNPTTDEGPPIPTLVALHENEGGQNPANNQSAEEEEN